MSKGVQYKPRGGLVLTASVDVQKDILEFEVVVWGPNRESWSVDYKILLGTLKKIISDINCQKLMLGCESNP